MCKINVPHFLRQTSSGFDTSSKVPPNLITWGPNLSPEVTLKLSHSNCACMKFRIGHVSSLPDLFIGHMYSLNFLENICVELICKKCSKVHTNANL